MIHLQLAKAGKLKIYRQFSLQMLYRLMLVFDTIAKLQYSSSEQFPILIIQLIKAYNNYE